MKKGKLFLTSALVIVLLLALCACVETPPEPTPQNPVKETYTVTFDANGGSGGRIAQVESGSTATLPVTPFRENYEFGGWYTDNANYSVAFTASTAVTGNITVYAKWTEKAAPPPPPQETKYQLTVTSGTGGSVSGTPTGEYALGYELVITATAEAGYAFDGWYSGATKLSGDSIYARSMPAQALAFEARFLPLAYELTFEKSLGTASAIASDVASGSSVPVTTSVTLTTADNGEAVFVGWYSGEELLSAEKTYSFKMPAHALHIVAKFTTRTYTLSVTSENSTYGSVECTSQNGPVAIYTPLTLTATANDGYSFIGWYYGSILESEEAELSFDMPKNDVAIVAKYSVNTYAFSYSVNDEARGSVQSSSPVGSLEYGTEITLQAVANTGYAFSCWTLGGDSVSTESQYVMSMPASQAAPIAVFIPQKYVMNYTVADETMGSVNAEFSTGAQIDYASRIVIHAVPAVGYAFVGWKDASDNTASGLADYSFPMPARDYTLTANFRLRNYTFSVQVPNADGGSVETSVAQGDVAYSTAVTITATPKQHNQFVGWYSGNTLVSSDAEYTFNMPASNYTITARFDTKTYALSYSVDSDSKGYIEHNVANGEVAVGKSVQLTAVPREGYRFLKWSDETYRTVSTETAYSFPMPATDVILIAEFEIVSSTLSYACANNVGGEISSETAQGSVNYGVPVTLTIVTHDGYSFVGWYVENEKVSDSIAYGFVMPANDYSVTAVFNVNSYNFSYGSSNTVYGSVSSANTVGSVRFGTALAVSATAGDGYAFAGWYSGETKVSTQADYSFTMPASNYYLTARFSACSNLLNFATESVDKGTVSAEVDEESVTDGASVEYKKEVVLTAVATTGYGFTGWYDGDDLISTEEEYVFDMPNAAVALTAKFVLEEYEMKFSASDNAMGSVASTIGASGTKLHYNDEVTITATPKFGHFFSCWRKGTQIVSTESVYTFDMPASDYALIAEFAANKHNFAYSVNPSAGGRASANVTAGKIAYGAIIELTAECNTGYNFLGWYDGDDRLSQELSYEISMPDEALSLTAKFQIISSTLTFSCKAAEGTVTATVDEVSTASGTSVAYNRAVVLTATPAAHYTLDGWYVGENKVSSAATYAFSMPIEALTAEARFIADSFDYSYSTTVVASEIPPAPTPTPIYGQIISSVEAGAVRYGTSITITVIPNDGRVLSYWTVNGTNVSSGNSYTFNMLAEDVEVVAVFATGTYVLTYGTNIDGGTISAKQSDGNDFVIDVPNGTSLNYNSSYMIKYTVKSGYRYVGLFANGVQITQTESSLGDKEYFTLMPGADTYYEARFELIG